MSRWVRAWGEPPRCAIASCGELGKVRCKSLVRRGRCPFWFCAKHIGPTGRCAAHERQGELELAGKGGV